MKLPGWAERFAAKGFDPRIEIKNDIDMRLTRRTSLNRLCDISDWRIGSELISIMRELGDGGYVHRKAWEYAFCIYGLLRLDAVALGGRAISVGAGYERPLFYFANTLREMVATDLYDSPDHE